MTEVSHKRSTQLELSGAALAGDLHAYPEYVELFGQGADPADVYLVNSGIIKLTRSEANGQAILVDLRFAGALLGAAAVISEKPHPFAAITVTRCALTRWSSQKFQSLLATDTKLADRVREVLSDEVLEHVARISQLTCLPARERLEQLLWQFSARLGHDDLYRRSESRPRLQLPLKHYEVAHLLSITPTYLCRLLNTLEKENVITRTKGWIVITEPSKLWHMQAS
jgi:CRP-like cAMP-binding protein